MAGGRRARLGSSGIPTGIRARCAYNIRARRGAVRPRRLYILCWSEFSRRRLLPAVSPATGHLTTPSVAGLPGLCENFRPTTSKSSPILRLLSSHCATSVVRTRVVGVANVGDSLRRLSSLQHRIYNLLGSDRHAYHENNWLIRHAALFYSLCGPPSSKPTERPDDMPVFRPDSASGGCMRGRSPLPSPRGPEKYFLT